MTIPGNVWHSIDHKNIETKWFHTCSGWQSLYWVHSHFTRSQQARFDRLMALHTSHKCDWANTMLTDKLLSHNSNIEMCCQFAHYHSAKTLQVVP